MKIILLLVLTLISTFCKAQKTDSLTSKIDNILKEYNQPNVPGCAVAVIKNGKVIFKKTYGAANLEYDIPFKSNTIFDVASVSKQFTGLAISTLIQQGKLSENDDIRKYLPDVPDFGKKITIHHLLHHTSGIRDWPATLNAAGWKMEDVLSFKDIMRMVKYQKDLDFEPGLEYAYSNTGYNLLAAVVEKITGKSFREWTDENIFKPIGMNASHFLDDHTKIIKNLAYSYSTNEKGDFVKTPSSTTAYGSSSLFTSLDDLCKWVIHFNKELQSKNPVYVRMLQQDTLNNGEKNNCGFGLFMEEKSSIKTIEHSGLWACYLTNIVNYPEENLSVILLSNTISFSLGKYTSTISNIFLKKKLKIEEKVKESIKNKPTVKVDNAILKKYIGTYQLRPSWLLTITEENEKLMVQATGEDKYPTDAKSDSAFWVPAYNGSITFEKDSTGNISSLSYGSIYTFKASKITPIIPDMSNLKQYIGSYYSEELGVEYRIDTANNGLTVKFRRMGDFDYMPSMVNKNEFIGGLGNIVFTKDDSGKIEGFKLSGGRTRNIRFDKRE